MRAIQVKMEEKKLRDAIKACETFALPSHDLDSEFHHLLTNLNQLKEEIAAQDESWKLFYIEEVNDLVGFPFVDGITKNSGCTTS